MVLRTLLQVSCMLLILSADHSSALLTNETSCDRHRSRMVVQVLEQYLEPHIQKVGYILPTICPLHPSRNILSRQERHKIPMRRHFWKCGFCDTVLRSEHWLDNHMDAKHPQEVDETADVCFADQCSAMHCEYLSTWAEGHYVDSLRAGHCRDRVMKERRRDCRAVADSCFPPSTGRQARLLHEYMVGTFCEAHTCQKRPRNQMLKRIRKAHRKGHVGYYFLIVVAIILMAAFYVGLWIYYSQNSGYRSQSGLRPGRRGQQRGWLVRLSRVAQPGKLD